MCVTVCVRVFVRMSVRANDSCGLFKEEKQGNEPEQEKRIM